MNLEDGYVPMDLFGDDHWSAFAYAETIMVDCAGFQVGFDGRMRQGRRHYRVMHAECYRPKRVRQAGLSLSTVMENRYSTRLNDGTTVEGHDDWHCVQDLVNAGLMGIRRRKRGPVTPNADAVRPRVILHLTPLGHAVIGQLRAHKAAGENFASFRPTVQPVAA